jgi:glycosyltransferase involved in cell wall biosynthesis
MPVCDGSRVLPASLEALCASDLPRELWELVVVDDGSLDGSATLAAAYADILVRLPGPPHGPAYARNRGVDASLGAILVFVDADVRAHPDALRRIAWAFAERGELGAVFGSHDADPPASNDVSVFHNLRHHYVHARAAGEAETFWASLGAVRREAFVQAGRFDEWHFLRPQIEDVELGYRIRRFGHRILCDPTIQGTHLKRWTMHDVVVGDLRDRVVPWIRLQLTLGRAGRPATLLFQPSEWVNSALVVGAVLLLLAALRLQFAPLAWGGALLLGAVLVANRRLYRFFLRARGAWFVLRVIPIHLVYHLLNGLAAAWAWVLFEVMGAPAPPPEIQAYSEKGLKTWPPLPTKADNTSWGGAPRQPAP